jgi:hypothetical protein
VTTISVSGGALFVVGWAAPLSCAKAGRGKSAAAATPEMRKERMILLQMTRDAGCDGAILA